MSAGLSWSPSCRLRLSMLHKYLTFKVDLFSCKKQKAKKQVQLCKPTSVAEKCYSSCSVIPHVGLGKGGDHLLKNPLSTVLLECRIDKV